MGQYYKTSKPTYVEDFMYQPPWELAKEVILAKDKAINDQIAGAAELDNLLNFNYLDFDEEKATQKQLEYRGKIQDIVTKIQQDPENYIKYKNDLITTSKALQADMTTGEIAAITGTYAGAEKFKKEHEKFREKEGARFNSGYNKFYENAAKAREEKGYTDPVWQSEQLMESIDFSKRFTEFLKEKKINRTASSGSGSDGRYIYTREGTNEQLTQAEVRSLMNDVVLTTPNAAQYIDQTKRIGMGDPLEGLLELSDNYAFNRQTSKSSTKTDTYGTINAKLAADLHKLEVKKQNDKDLIDYKNSSGGMYAGVVETGTFQNMFGLSVGKLYNRELPDDQKVGPNAIKAIGMPSLFMQGVISNSKQANVIQSTIDMYEKGGDFGSNQFVLVPQRNMSIRDKDGKIQHYKAGENYLLGANAAISKGILTISPGTGKPFYFNTQLNGISFNASAKPTDSKDTVEEGAFKVLLMPPNPKLGIKNGVDIYSQFRVK